MRSGARVAVRKAATIDSRGTVLTFRPPTALVPASEMGLLIRSSSTPSLSFPRLFTLLPLPNPSRRRLTLLVRIEPVRVLSCPGAPPDSPAPMPTRDEDAAAFRSAIDMSLRIGDSCEQRRERTCTFRSGTRELSMWSDSESSPSGDPGPRAGQSIRRAYQRRREAREMVWILFGSDSC